MKAMPCVIKPSSENRPGHRQRQTAGHLGQVYDNEDLSRKAKQMEKQVARLKESQTELTAGTPWRLALNGDALRADVCWRWNSCRFPAPGLPALFTAGLARLRSGDRVAIMGRNGGGNRRCCACCGGRCSRHRRMSDCACIRDYIRATTTRRCISWRITTLLEALESFEPAAGAVSGR
jgi:hypothetical protein